MEPKVKFFFVGVGKCGTTWIFAFLSRHKVVSVPQIKEPYLIDATPAKQAKMVATLWDDPVDMADFSNLYHFDPENAAKIAAYNPDAKVIFTLRLPSKRMFSHFRFMKSRALVSQDIALHDYLQSGDEMGLVTRSDYAPMIQRYIDALGADNVLVQPLELLQRDPQAYADRLLTFLGKPSIAVDDDDRQKVLGATRARWPLLSVAVREAVKLLRALGLLRLLGALKSSPRLTKLLFAEDNRPPEDMDLGPFAQKIYGLDADYPALLAGFDPKLADLFDK